MKVYKASAGSGKTYTLSHEYIKLLLSSKDRYAYRHILAVTFTNKATAEMKSRILEDLLEESGKDPEACRILTDILHDYSAFAVSTIDRFFQQTLRAFSREIGQFSAYQLELEGDLLVTESMDRILDGLTEEKTELVDWLKRSAMTRIEQGERFNIDSGLSEIGNLLKSDEYSALVESYGLDEKALFSKERLSAVRESCRKVISDFEKKAAAALWPVAGPDKKNDPPSKTAKQKDPVLAALFDKPYVYYLTAVKIDKVIFSLGLAGEFRKEFEELLKEKNVMPLDDSNIILRDIIDGSDAPFVYEKMGVRFEDFLLDEFQDTSRIQWANFRPLLLNSEAGGGENLIVGDVKQSIYRWRNSDWELLGNEVEKTFKDVEIVPKKENWRSAETVVTFNSEFFAYAAAQVGTSDIYSDVGQIVRSKEPQKGSVRVSFTDDQDPMVLSSISDACGRGAKYGDIAILVRNRKEGTRLASVLIGAGIPVLSDDSLTLKSSLTVRRIVSLLSTMENPDDTVGSFIATSMGIKFPENYHSLVDFVEGLLRSVRDFDPDTFAVETLYIEAFMDTLQSWVDEGGNSLRYFLKKWEEKDLVIGSPKDTDSVHIITVHKSKGLQFPFVIFPYAETVKLYKDSVHWCYVDCKGTPLGEEATGVYPVNLSKSLENTLFAPAYERECQMQKVDNINVFYVAMTRARKELHVIAKSPSKTCRDSKGKHFGNFSEILYNYCGGYDDRSYGEPYNYLLMERDPLPKVKEFPATYETIPIAGRLQASDDAFDYFGEDGSTGSAASRRLSGIELHAILSTINSPEDLPLTMDPDSRRMLESRIAAHPEWFGVPGGRALNEVTIFDETGLSHRPDRVIISPEGVTVVDYKFGARSGKHIEQVQTYMALYRRMGYPNVSGFVWYVPDDLVVKVQ